MSIALIFAASFAAGQANVLQQVRASLLTAFPPELVDLLLDAYVEAKRRFQIGDLRPSAVEGGRFCEAAFRLLQHTVGFQVTPIGTAIDADSISRSLANRAQGSTPDSVRLHIPRALRVVYDIRNNRDAAHLADGIDPNLQDATLVVCILDWVLAEFIRLHHKVPPAQAQKIVSDLVTRQLAVLQEIDGVIRILRPSLDTTERVLVLLYHYGAAGAQWHQLHASLVEQGRRKDLQYALNLLVYERAMAHFNEETGVYQLTSLGQRHVEEKRLHEA